MRRGQETGLPEVPLLRVSGEIPEGTSPYIAESLRRTLLEQQQRDALMSALTDQGIPDVRWARALLEGENLQRRQLKRDALRRSRIRGTTCESFTRAEIIKRDGRRCYLCGRTDLKDSEIHLDHLTPLSRGGSHTKKNVSVACARCNHSKGSKTVDEYLSSDHYPR